MRIQYTLKVYPAGLGRSVYRTITICGTDTLDQLCMAILSAFDFTAEHLYEFCMDNNDVQRRLLSIQSDGRWPI